MFHWRISKYDPRSRDERGAYTRNEWSGPAHVGVAFDDGVLMLGEYLRVEALYVDAVLGLWRAAGTPSLQIQALETSTAFGLPSGDEHLASVDFGDAWTPTNGAFVVDAPRISAIVRWCLRDLGWCELVHRNFALRPGYDFLVGVASTAASVDALRVIEESGLFVEVNAAPLEVPSYRLERDDD